MAKKKKRKNKERHDTVAAYRAPEEGVTQEEWDEAERQREEELYEKRKKTMLHARQFIDYSKRKPSYLWKPKTPKVTRAKLRKAILGAYGVPSRVAKRLGIQYQSLRRIFKKWPDLEARNEEKLRLVDEAENTVAFMIKQREEFGTALQAAKLVLVAKGGWKTRNEVRKIEGGGNTTTNVTVNKIEVRSLPLELRRRLLETIEAAQPMKEIEAKVIEPDGQ